MDFEISPGQVKSLQKRGEAFTLLDVREAWEYEASRIEGAKHIPMGDVPTRAHQELDPDDHIVVLCHHGVRSLTVTNWLRQQGYEKVQSMRGETLGQSGQFRGGIRRQTTESVQQNFFFRADRHHTALLESVYGGLSAKTAGVSGDSVDGGIK